MDPPSRDDVLERLRDLCQGRLPRETVTDWAMSFVRADAVPDDRQVWRALECLTLADSEVASGEYLYHVEDFRAWLEALER